MSGTISRYVPPPNHEPPPEEIREVCERIRATWSPYEERMRRAWSISGPIEFERPVRLSESGREEA